MMQEYVMDSISRESMYRRAVQLEEEAREALKGANNPTDRVMWNAILGERTAFKHDIMDAKSTRPQWIMMSDRKPDTRGKADGYYYVAVTSDSFSVDYKETVDNWKKYPNGSHYWEGEVSKKHRVHAWAERPDKFDYWDMHSTPKENFQERRNIGHWILCGNEDQDPEDVKNNNFRYTCSCCSASDTHASTQEVPYCWSCGARMLGEAVMDRGQSTQDIIKEG